MKKRFFLLLSIILIVTVLINAAMAESEATIFADKAECSSGDTVRYSVNIKGNPGIAGFLVSVVSEDDWLYFDEEVEHGDFSDLGSISASYEPQRLNVLWFNADNVTGDGTLFSFDVHVSPSAPDGDYPIKVFVSDKNTLNDKYEPVSFTAEDGCITVVHKDMTAEKLNELAEKNIRDAQKAEMSVNAIWIAVIAVAVVAALLFALKFVKKK